jgi:tetratricopeptide (TPR) repeat protein
MPTPNEDKRLRAVADALRPAVVAIGNRVSEQDGPRILFQGTGFVISKRKRLVATAAHIADIKAKLQQVIAVTGSSRHAYSIARVWYHPEVERDFDRGLRVRSNDPKFGENVSCCPDVAVIELSRDGADLSHEVTLGTHTELGDLPGQAVGVLAYPYVAIPSWPLDGQPPTATYARCLLGEMLGDRGDDNSAVPVELRRVLSYKPSIGYGASGSPVFRANGHVVGLTNASWPTREFPVGAMRIDRLRELLDFHRLSEPDRGAPGRVSLLKEERSEPRLTDLRHAVELVAQAARLRRAGNYRQALAMCDDALHIAPNYGRAFLERGKVYLFCFALQADDLEPAVKRRYIEQAWQDSYRALEICRQWNEAFLIHCQIRLYRYGIDRDPAVLRAVLEATEGFQRGTYGDGEPTDWQRGFLSNLRGQALHFLGHDDAARREYTESIRLASREPLWYLNRAQFFDETGEPQLAAKDRRRAEAIRRAEPIDEGR